MKRRVKRMGSRKRRRMKNKEEQGKQSREREEGVDKRRTGR